MARSTVELGPAARCSAVGGGCACRSPILRVPSPPPLSPPVGYMFHPETPTGLPTHRGHTPRHSAAPTGVGAMFLSRHYTRVVGHGRDALVRGVCRSGTEVFSGGRIYLSEEHSECTGDEGRVRRRGGGRGRRHATPRARTTRATRQRHHAPPRATPVRPFQPPWLQNTRTPGSRYWLSGAAASVRSIHSLIGMRGPT